MEVDSILLNKLKYIEDHQIKIKQKKQILNEEINDLNFANIKGKEYKLIKQYNRNFSNQLHDNKKTIKNEEDFINFAFLQQMNKKLNILHAYSNLAVIVILLKYLDMIIVVKRGGK